MAQLCCRNPFFKTTINKHRRILVGNVSFAALWAEINPYFKGILEKFCSKTDLIFVCIRVQKHRQLERDNQKRCDPTAYCTVVLTLHASIYSQFTNCSQQIFFFMIILFYLLSLNSFLNSPLAINRVYHGHLSHRAVGQHLWQLMLCNL